MSALTRKAGQVVRDPVLRRFLLDRALGRIENPAPFTPHCPPYLPTHQPHDSVLPIPSPTASARPQGGISVDLPGMRLDVDPADPGAVFDLDFADGETAEALHRFAWLPLTPDVSADWVFALWDAWVRRFVPADPRQGGDERAWNAYTAAERVCNILDYGQRVGWPGGWDHCAAVLAHHAPRIRAGLEYYGETATHNHLANDGRGLYRLGVALGLAAPRQTGLAILTHEAERLFRPSGILREGSSHYHLLYTRNYADCWLAARAAGLTDDAGRLEAVVTRLLAVLPHLALPGGLPLVGDISPDSPPDYLVGLLPGRQDAGGWMARLAPGDRAGLLALMATVRPVGRDVLAADGWLRLDRGPWAGMVRAEPAGWVFSPGHGHQDWGSLVLHHRDQPVLVDCGRGAYGETGHAALYRTGQVHNGVTVDGCDPYAVNRPYYTDAFRRKAGGEAAAADWTDDDARILAGGFARIGAGAWRRRIQVEDGQVVITDRIAGRGRFTVTRHFHTPLPVVIKDDHVELGGRFRLRAPGGRIIIAPARLWVAYGRDVPGWAIRVESPTRLPWDATTVIEAF